MKKNNLIGLVPAAGMAHRLSPLPLSKELYPIGFSQLENKNSFPKPVCLNLLENMRQAHVTNAFIILRNGKWDIPAYLAGGHRLGINLSYLVMNVSHGVPFTLDQAYPFIQDRVVVFGFPDIIFSPSDAFIELIEKQAECNADVVLGLFPADNPKKGDMVALDENGNICDIQIKPAQTTLSYSWIIAVWKYSFTHFMHGVLKEMRITEAATENVKKYLPSRELHIGHVIKLALKSNLLIEKVIFNEGNYIDIGTGKDMVRALKMYLPQSCLE